MDRNLPVFPHAENPVIKKERIPKGVLTDQKLISWYYEVFEGVDTAPITTDKFLEKSKDQYNAPWLCRELIQNFVDHNPNFPGTLNGVPITMETLEDGAVRLRIQGNWPFIDPTGVISAHSEKPTDFETAGGNGIGLKQAAIRLLRDFNVTKFDVNGEKWSIHYRLERKQELNDKIQQKTKEVLEKNNSTLAFEVKHDWLVGDLEENDNTGVTSYVIETTDPELIEAFRDLKNLGVSEENDFLNNPDIENEYGKIKWLPLGELEGKKFSHMDYADGKIKIPKGRTFLNGQVMSYKENGKTVQDYWQGPELVNVQMNNVKYEMNIDRPPLNAYKLELYISSIIMQMTGEECIEQLKKTEYIWTTIPDIGKGAERFGCYVIIKSIIDRLSWDSSYKNKDFQRIFGDKFLAKEAMTKEQEKSLISQGYILCPAIFEKIGMPSASSKLEKKEKATLEKPNVYKSQQLIDNIAHEHGIEVGFEDIETFEFNEYFNLLRKRLKDVIIKFQQKPEAKNSFQVFLDIEFGDLEINHPLHNPKKEEQKLLKFIRGFIFRGLENNFFKDQRCFLSQGNYISTFLTEYNTFLEEKVLYSRNIPAKDSSGVYFEFELDDEKAKQLREILQEEIEQDEDDEILFEEPEVIKKSQPEVADKETEKQGAVVPKEVEDILDNPIEQQEDVKKGSPLLEKLKYELKNIPIEHPQPKKQSLWGRVSEVFVKTEKPSDELTERIPMLEKIVGHLSNIVPQKESPEEISETDPVNQYINWRKSNDFYGQASLKSQYLSGNTLLGILSEMNRADIASVKKISGETEEEKSISRLNQELQSLTNRLSAKEDSIEDFEIILNPTEKQMAQLTMLREYAQFVTDVPIPNDLFIYDGKGAKGVNIAQKAIGLHFDMLNVSFFEAYSTMVHELGHNVSMKHDVLFMQSMQSLFSVATRKHAEISRKLIRQEPLTAQETTILDIEMNW